MRKIRVLREHTECYFKTTGILHTVFHLEGVQITVFLNQVKRLYGVNVLFTFGIGIDGNQFQTYRIIQALFVDNISDGIFFTAFDAAFNEFFRLFTISIESHFSTTSSFHAAISFAFA